MFVLTKFKNTRFEFIFTNLVSVLVFVIILILVVQLCYVNIQICI